MRRVEGSVLTLACSGCRAAFPTFQFSGDTDMVTAGLGSATFLDGLAVAIGEMTPAEWSDRESGLVRFAKRISQAEGSAFEAVRLLRAETTPSPSASVSLAQFRRTYQAPRLIFECPRCSREATVSSSSSAAEFVSSGGRLVLLGEVAVA